MGVGMAIASVIFVSVTAGIASAVLTGVVALLDAGEGGTDESSELSDSAEVVEVVDFLKLS